MANSVNKSKLKKLLQKNSNVTQIDSIREINANTTAKDLTEAQKQAFIAMMRMAADPQDRTWTARKKRMDRRKEKITRQIDEKKNSAKPLKHRIAEMRIRRTFPLAPQTPGDRTRRYGFIPQSQRKRNLNEYAKV